MSSLVCHEADVGTEADAWNHAEAHGRLSTAVSFRFGVTQKRRTLWAHLIRDRGDEVVGAIRDWHAPLSPVIWMEEVLGLLTSDAVTDEECKEALESGLRSRHRPKLATG